MTTLTTRKNLVQNRQLGLSLPTVLMFLVIITVVGTVGIRRATVSEALTRNQMDYEVARQAAEAALRDAERDLRLTSGALVAGARCARGVDERPLEDRVSPLGPTDTCLMGQCRFATGYYDTSQFPNPPTTPAAVNPAPSWPLGQGGQWVTGTTDTVATVAAQKPTAVNDSKCTTFTGGVPLGTFTGVPAFASVAQQPEYLIEYIKGGDGKLVMRITARGFGTDPRTEAVLQSYFEPALD